MPSLPTISQKSDSILIGSNTATILDEGNEISTGGGKWEDEEERRFYEEVQDLKDFVPSSLLGIGGTVEEEGNSKDNEKERMDREKEEVRKLEEELEKLEKDFSDSTEERDVGNLAEEK